MTRQQTCDAYNLAIRNLVDVCIREKILNGNGHSIYRPDVFYRVIDNTFHTELDALNKEHVGAFYHNCGSERTGIWGLEFHYWIAEKISTVDTNFYFAQKIGKGFQAQAIYSAAKAWVERMNQLFPCE